MSNPNGNPRPVGQLPPPSVNRSRFLPPTSEYPGANQHFAPPPGPPPPGQALATAEASVIGMSRPPLPKSTSSEQLFISSGCSSSGGSGSGSAKLSATIPGYSPAPPSIKYSTSTGDLPSYSGGNIYHSSSSSSNSSSGSGSNNNNNAYGPSPPMPRYGSAPPPPPPAPPSYPPPTTTMGSTTTIPLPIPPSVNNNYSSYNTIPPPPTSSTLTTSSRNLLPSPITTAATPPLPPEARSTYSRSRSTSESEMGRLQVSVTSAGASSDNLRDLVNGRSSITPRGSERQPSPVGFYTSASSPSPRNKLLDSGHGRLTGDSPPIGRTRNPDRSSARLDPTQMPRPERGLTDISYHTRSGSGRRNPPSCNSIFTAIDTGNCLPRHMRVTMSAPPASADTLSKVGLPFAVITTPFAPVEHGEEPVALVDFADTFGGHELAGSPTGRSPKLGDVSLRSRPVQRGAGKTNGLRGTTPVSLNQVEEDAAATEKPTPPRCGRCRGYINPSVVFTEEGHRWTCNLCGMSANEVPEWYFCPLDGSGQRQDRVRRAELQLGSVDFVVDDNYCVRDLQDPIFVFAIDVSTRAMSNGTMMSAVSAVESAVEQLAEVEKRETIIRHQIFMKQQHDRQRAEAKAKRTGNFFSENCEEFVKESAPIRVGIVTFDSQVQFYALNPNKSTKAISPMKIFVCDPNDPFCPLPTSEWLFPVASKHSEVARLLNDLPEILANSRGYYGTTDGSQRNDSGLSDTGCCPTAAIKAIQGGLARCGGRIFVVTSSHSTTGFGQMPVCRERHVVYGTSKEASLYAVPAARSQAAAAAKEAANGNTGAAAAAHLLVGVADNNASSRHHAGVNHSHPSSVQRSTSATAELLSFSQSIKHYDQLAKDCNESVVCVSVVACVGSDPYTEDFFFDTCMLGETCARTGGRLYMLGESMLLPENEENVNRLQDQLLHAVSTAVAAESVVKIRTSEGLRVDRWLVGQGMLTNTSNIEGDDEIAMAGMDTSTTLCVKLRHESPAVKFKDEERVHLQVAVLATTLNSYGGSSGTGLTPREQSSQQYRRRVVRVHNLTLLASSKPSLVFRNSDIEVVATTLLKEAALRALDGVPLNESSGSSAAAVVDSGSSSKSRSVSPMAADVNKLGPRSFLDRSVIQPLLQYRLNCSVNSPKGQLILPESLKVLPVYVLGMLKHPAIIDNHSAGASARAGGRGGDGSSGYGSMLARVSIRGNSRAHELLRITSLPLKEVVNSIYPRVYSLLDMFENDDQLLLSSHDCMDGVSACASIDREDSQDVAEMREIELIRKSVFQELANATPQKTLGDHLRRSPRSDHHQKQPSFDLSPFLASHGKNNVTESQVGTAPFRNQAANSNNALNTSMTSMFSEGETTYSSLLERIKQRSILTQCASSEIFESDGLYLVDDRSCLWLFIGRSVSQHTIEELFDPYVTGSRGLPRTSLGRQPDTVVFNRGSELGSRINVFVNYLRASSVYKQDLRVIWADQQSSGDGSLLFSKFSSRLVEDSIQGLMSYSDYLCSLHLKIQKEIANKF